MLVDFEIKEVTKEVSYVHVNVIGAIKGSISAKKILPTKHLAYYQNGIHNFRYEVLDFHIPLCNCA